MEERTFEVDGRAFVVRVPQERYLARMMRLAELQDTLATGFSVATLRAFLAFLADYVVPADGGDPVEALMDLTEDGLAEVSKAIQGRTKDPLAAGPEKPSG